ncbi:hypothetical protein [Phreatobacter sp.]|uniref:hypothetical protein n=1 Tax=Phreatobacter sp. TaxID=1966341 RepID=UPI0025E1C0F0|nr:hypothetical protein [Phreatobacter sp.]
MRHTVPWSVKGVDQDAREAAKEAARRSGMSLGEWLNSAIADQAAEVSAAAVTDTGLSTVTRRLESISQRLDAVTRRETETAIPKLPTARSDNSDIVRALDAVARLAEISERRSAAAIEAVERLGGTRPAPSIVSAPAMATAATPGRADHSAQMDAIARSIRSLDMPAPRHVDVTNGISIPRKNFRSDIDMAVAEIAARQKSLAHGHSEAPLPMAAAPADPLAMPDMAPIAARLDALSRQIETVLNQPRSAAPRAPESTALAGEIGRLSQRIDAMAVPASDGLQSEIRTLSGRVEQMRRDLAERETGHYDRAVADLRSDIAAIADQLSDLAPRRAVASLEAEVQGLGARLDAARAQGLPAEPLEQLVHEFERALARLMPAEGIADELKALSYRVDTLASRDLSGGLLDRLTQETGAIRAMLADTVSRDAIDALGDQIAALGRRIDELAQPRQTSSDVAAITSAIEARIEEIAERLAAVPRPAAAPATNPQLEEALHRLADKLEDGHARPDDPKALADIERHILSLAAKIDAADGRFAQLGTIERGLSDLFVQMEEMRAGAIEAAEQAARKALAAAPGSGTDDEIEALRREIAEVRRSRLAIDQKGSDTVDAVQQTFERVAKRIAEIEPAEAPPVAASPPLAPRDPEPALARPKSASAPLVAERPAAPVSRQTAPGRPPGSVDLPLEPGSGAPRVRPPAPGAAPVGGTKTDFIAAARRAARAAAVDPALRPEPEENAKPGFFARFRGAPKDPDDVQPAAPQPKKPRWLAKSAREDAAPVIPAPEPVAIQPAAEAELELARKPILAVNRKTILMGIAAALLVLAAGIATVPKIRSLVDATGTQQTAIPAATVETPAAAPISDAPAAPAPASNLSPASTSATPAELIAPAAGPSATDPTPAMPGGDTAPATTGSVSGSRTPPPGMTVSPSGWQPVDTRTGRPASVPAALKAAADAGDPLAAHEMGTRHLEGRGVAVSAAEAARWYQRAADAGIVPAQYRLGSLYEKGTGVLRDFERARRLYERAGEAGNAKAMHNLAVMFAQGQATPRPDYKTAAQWFRRAAEHGVTDSQYNLGILYARGLGVDQSLAESYKWFALAAAGGDQDSAKKRDEVAARLDAQTLVAARLAVQTFAPKAEPDAAVRVAAPAEWSDPPAAARPATPRRAQTTR